MADADEPWMREWISSVADDMMREHSYMEVSLRGGELASVSLTEVGATCASLLDGAPSNPREITDKLQHIPEFWWPTRPVVGHQALALLG